MKSAVAWLLGLILKPFNPHRLARYYFSLVHIAARTRKPEDSLIFLLELERDLFVLTGTEACRYGDGVHPKHWHTGYHDFFVQRLRPEERVLDIGCGYGALAYDMAETGALVTGIDMNEKNISVANERFVHDNLTFIVGDVNKDIPNDRVDTVVMSNVLEHLDNRVEFLKGVQQKLTPDRWLIRVPMFERDWRVPLMEELNVDYRLDDTHFIEYRKEEFLNELKAAGLRPSNLEYIWGEIWCEAQSETGKKHGG